MKNFTLIACLFVLGLYFIACQPDNKTVAGTEAKPAAPMPEKPAMTKADSVKRGEYLVTTMGCNDCHSPKTMTPQGPVPDATRLLSGHPSGEVLPKITDKSMIAPGHYYLMSSGLTSFTGPWGTSFAANLTPDATGLGNWTYENFERAVRQGKFMGMENGRPLLPPMPWQNLVNLTKEDLSNIWQYLRSLKPIKNVVPNPLPPV